MRTAAAPSAAAAGPSRPSGATNMAEASRENPYHVGEIRTQLGLLNL